MFGVALAAMNLAFYVAIDHLPLGTAVAIEFLGPVAVAAVTGRGWRERGGIAVAAAGVVLLAGVTIESDLPREDVVLGLGAISVAATCWGAYILLGRRVAVAGSGVTSLAVAMAVGALVFAPFLAPSAVPVLTDWRYVVAVAGIAVFSSVVPYALEQVILRRVSAATFSVLLALLPATAVVVGAVVLRQVPTGPESSGSSSSRARSCGPAGTARRQPSAGGPAARLTYGTDRARDDRRARRPRGLAQRPGMPPGPPGPGNAGGQCGRICESCACAAICWATRAVWMPWNRPSSHPTSWACATRSSASVGTASSANGSVIRCSSSTSSGERPSSSSLSERSWISASRERPPRPAGRRAPRRAAA